MKISLDFADSARAGSVPRHGWARNSQGVKLLWLPVLRLGHEAHEYRQANGRPEALSDGQWSEIRAFQQTTMHFCFSLRELAKCIRLGCDPYFDTGNDEKFSASREVSTLIPLYVDLSFVYARRLADHFARAIRYVLFKHPKSAPREYKNLRPVVAELAKLLKLEPMCNAALLQKAFERYSGWLDKLRESTDENGELQKGIRDILEHHPVAVSVRHAQASDETWEVFAYLGDPGTNPGARHYLIQTLKEIVADMAALWTSVCVAVPLAPAQHLWVAPFGDAVPLTGNDDDSTAYWPESTA